jgi:hypothetical protein
MSSPRLDDDPFSFDFSDQFLAEFGFGNFLPAEGLLFSFGSYNHEFDDDSFTFSLESYVGVGNHRRPRRKKRRPNHQYREKSSVNKSCWFREFLRPGMTRDLTHELSASDRFGEFRSYFLMPLSKVEELTDTFINRGHLKPARSFLQQSEFREQSELFILSALYRLGTGASFRTCRALCHISTSEVQLFFDTFLHAMHEMWEEYISMPTKHNAVAPDYQILRGSWIARLLRIDGCGSCQIVSVSNRRS